MADREQDDTAVPEEAKPFKVPPNLTIHMPPSRPAADTVRLALEEARRRFGGGPGASGMRA